MGEAKSTLSPAKRMQLFSQFKTIRCSYVHKAKVQHMLKQQMRTVINLSSRNIYKGPALFKCKLIRGMWLVPMGFFKAD